MFRTSDYLGPNSRIIVTSLLVEVLGATFLSLIVIWVQIYLRGASLSGDRQQLTNLHAIFMPLSLVYLEGNGIIIYRLMKGYQSRDVKYLHYGLQTIAFLFMIFGYFAAYFSRDSKSRAYFSLHDWLGIIVIIVFLIEFFGGIYFFHSTRVTRKVQELTAAFHAFFGLFNCMLAIWVSCLGISSLATNTILVYSVFTAPSVLANCSGVLMLFFGATVFFICTHPDFEWDKVAAIATAADAVKNDMESPFHSQSKTSYKTISKTLSKERQPKSIEDDSPSIDPRSSTGPSLPEPESEADVLENEGRPSIADESPRTVTIDPAATAKEEKKPE